MNNMRCPFCNSNLEHVNNNRLRCNVCPGPIYIILKVDKTINVISTDLYYKNNALYRAVWENIGNGYKFYLYKTREFNLILTLPVKITDITPKNIIGKMPMLLTYL